MAAHRTLSALVNDVEALTRLSGTDDGVIQNCIRLAAKETAELCRDTEPFRVVGTHNVVAGTSSADITQGGTLGIVGDVPHVSFEGDGLRFTPQWESLKDFRQIYQRSLEVTSSTGRPRVWTVEKFVDDLTNPTLGGKVTIRWFPAADVNYTIRYVMNFIPHGDTADGLGVRNLIWDHVLTMGASAYLTMLRRMNMSDSFRLEYFSALGSLKTATANVTRSAVVGGGTVHDRRRRRRGPFIDDTV